MDFAIEEWSPDGARLIETLAASKHIHIATAAYWAALRERPKSLVMLRNKALVLAQRGPEQKNTPAPP